MMPVTAFEATHVFSPGEQSEGMIDTHVDVPQDLARLLDAAGERPDMADAVLDAGISTGYLREFVRAGVPVSAALAFWNAGVPTQQARQFLARNPGRPVGNMTAAWNAGLSPEFEERCEEIGVFLEDMPAVAVFCDGSLHVLNMLVDQQGLTGADLMRLAGRAPWQLHLDVAGPPV